MDADGKPIQGGQELCSSLLEECGDIAQEIKARGESIKIHPTLQPIYNRLQELRKELESLSLTHRWTLKETDLYNYNVALQEMDRMRKEGKWNVMGEDGKELKATGQYVSHGWSLLVSWWYTLGRYYYMSCDDAMAWSTNFFPQANQ